MIGVFDSGLGGLTVLRALVRRFPNTDFTYLGDHAHVPYGDRSSEHIIALTQAGIDTLFERGCRLVLLGCNTATAVAARHLQQNWIPDSRWAGTHNVLGIVAPTVEAATQTPWAVTTPQYPQKNNVDSIAIFGTTRTIKTNVYVEEIKKRCPKAHVVQQICSGLAGAIEAGGSADAISALIANAVTNMTEALDGRAPDQVILGCTHFPLAEHIFKAALPDGTRLLSQPEIVADSLEDYLARHPNYTDANQAGRVTLLTTGNPDMIHARATVFWPDVATFTATETNSSQT